MRRVVLCLALLSTFGCAESATLLSEPSRAKVYIDGRFVGLSPATFLVGQGEEAHYRVVLDGYEPSEGQLLARLAPGRVVGTVFTFGIYAIFRSLHYYPPTNVALTPSSSPQPEAHGATAPESPEDRLRHVKNLYDQRLISEQEYQRLRSDILRELDPPK